MRLLHFLNTHMHYHLAPNPGSQLPQGLEYIDVPLFQLCL
jgi:hypothetical protein